ncbi:MAG: hypothetical protein FD126_801 [Elusimicrobia bacterium]|nr:MAG: hypothetical protein FD126_801 [Elusimicrobiota bacterium]
MVDLSRQTFVVARFADYCAFSRPYPRGESDPVRYLLNKLSELEDPMYLLKQELYDSAWKRFIKQAAVEGVTAEEATDLRSKLEGFLAPGDFFDASFHLMDPAGLKDPARRKLAEACLSGLKAERLTEEEERPPEKQSKLYRKLTEDMTKRLHIDLLDTVRRRKPLTLRRMLIILRRLRFETAEYAAVFHCPTSPDDTFNPFILPRIEALVAVNRRFLKTLRTR